MSDEYGFFQKKKKRMIESMKSLEATFENFQNLHRINLVANAMSEVAEDNPQLLSMIVSQSYTPHHLIKYAYENMPHHSAWAALAIHHQILFREDVNDEKIAFKTNKFDIDAVALKLDQKDNSKVFLEMLYAMSTSRPDLSGKKPIHLVLSGGGAKGFGHVGMLEAFEEYGLWDAIETVAGTSAGGLIAAFAALGMRPKDIAEIVHEKDFSGFIYEFKSILSKIAHVANPNHRMLRNVAFLDEFTKFMKIELAEYLISSHQSEEWEKELLLNAKEKGQQAVQHTLASILSTYYTQEEMLFMVDKMDSAWMRQATDKCTKLAEESLGVQRPEDNAGNSFYKITKLTPKNLWYGMDPYMTFSNPRDAIVTSMNIMTKNDTVQAFIGRIIYERMKDLANKCNKDLGMKKKFVTAMTGKTPSGTVSNWPDVSDTSLANVSFVQLERLRTAFPEEGFKKLLLTFCERNGTILNKNNIVAVSVDAQSEKYANMRILDAMCATMRLPVVFSPYVFQKPDPLSKTADPAYEFKRELERYVDPSEKSVLDHRQHFIKGADGGLLQNFPVKSVEDRVVEPRQVIGFYLAPEQNFLSAQHFNELSNPKHAVENPGENGIITYLRNKRQGLNYLQESIHGDKQVSKYQLTPAQQIRIGVINVKQTGTVDFHMNSVQKTELMAAGYDTAERILRQQSVGLMYDINTAFWAEKFMAKINQFDKEGLTQALDTPQLQDRWEAIKSLKKRVGKTTAPGLSI